MRACTRACLEIWVSSPPLLLYNLHISLVPPPFPIAEVEYRFTINTGARMFAGTNARVYASLFGDMGNTGPSNFTQTIQSFQRGCRDTFVVRTLDVGFVKALR
jgi:hypothetical protein